MKLALAALSMAMVLTNDPAIEAPDRLCLDRLGISLLLYSPPVSQYDKE